MFDEAGAHHVFEGFGDQSETVLGVDLPPDLPAEDGGRIEEHDATHRRVHGGIEKGQAAQAELLHRIASGQRGLADASARSPWTSWTTARNSPCLVPKWCDSAPRVTPARSTISSWPAPAKPHSANRARPASRRARRVVADAFGLCPSEGVAVPLFLRPGGC